MICLALDVPYANCCKSWPSNFVLKAANLEPALEGTPASAVVQLIFAAFAKPGKSVIDSWVTVTTPVSIFSV